MDLSILARNSRHASSAMRDRRDTSTSTSCSVPRVPGPRRSGLFLWRHGILLSEATLHWVAASKRSTDAQNPPSPPRSGFVQQVEPRPANPDSQDLPAHRGTRSATLPPAAHLGVVSHAGFYDTSPWAALNPDRHLSPRGSEGAGLEELGVLESCSNLKGGIRVYPSLP